MISVLAKWFAIERTFSFSGLLAVPDRFCHKQGSCIAKRFVKCRLCSAWKHLKLEHKMDLVLPFEKIKRDPKRTDPSYCVARGRGTFPASKEIFSCTKP